ncbi:alpha/beta fold hydrolase [Massilia niastensis]|uniref:alpha/beta fold hydrolase n=1 Tax=Massilia niastensis TaxID=544911 RepID=UPI000378CC5C|nr:alpha/beta fold hydrolase [Massilia niastensis]
MNAARLAAAADAVTAAGLLLQRMTRPRRMPLGEAQAALLAQAERLAFTVEGATLAGHAWGGTGPGEVRPRVLLAHGWESRAAAWHAFVPVLAAAGWQVVALDFPAHGDSPGAATDVVAMGKALVTVGSRLGRVDALVAHSLGSPASLYAFAHGLDVAASVHLSGPASLVRALERAERHARLPPPAAALFRARFEDRLGHPAATMDLERLAHGLRHPALLLHDPEDPEVPYAESEALAAAWPQALLEPAPGAGHRRIIEDAALARRAAAFLGARLAARA